MHYWLDLSLVLPTRPLIAVTFTDTRQAMCAQSFTDTHTRALVIQSNKMNIRQTQQHQRPKQLLYVKFLCILNFNGIKWRDKKASQ